MTTKTNSRKPDVSSKRPARKRSRPQSITQTSPITIGGGSVTIDFDHGWFKRNNPLKPKQYWNPNDLIEKLWIVDEYGHKTHIPEADRWSTITIHCINDHDSLDDSPIKVTCFPLGLEFEGSEYPYNSRTKVHLCSYRQMTTVAWHDKVVFVAKKGQCRIDIDDPNSNRPGRHFRATTSARRARG